MALARALAIEPTALPLDEPFGALDAKVRKELRTWLRRLHDEVHATTVFVTHDQDEALEVADQIVVISDGRIEQVGTPDELYDAPAPEFVMSFRGPVITLGGQLVRPHDIEIEPTMPTWASGNGAGLAAPGRRSVHHRGPPTGRSSARTRCARSAERHRTRPARRPSPGQSGPPPSDISSPALGGREILVRR